MSSPLGDLALNKIAKVVGEMLPSSSKPRLLVVSGKRTLDSLGGLTFEQEVAKWATHYFWLYSGKLATTVEGDHLGKIVNSFKPELVIGLGGGVAMDLAKIASTLSGEELLSLENQDPSTWSTRRELLIPTLLVPTLFGSGAEETFHAVLYKRFTKYSMAFHPTSKMRSVHIPELSSSASTNQRLSAALDAICQALETSWSTQATDESRALALSGLKGVIQGFDDYVGGICSHAQMLFVEGASKIGRAMNVGRTTGPHALSYFLSARAGLSHGHAVALILRDFWSYMNSNDFRKNAPGGLLETLNECQRLIDKLLGTSVDFDQWLQGIFEKNSLSSGIRDVLLDNNLTIEEFLKSANLERLSNNPFMVDEGLLKKILKF
jgi:alcohol dehydrogenase class IV